MDSNKSLYAGTSWALTAKALKLKDELIASGFDYDLAMAWVEHNFPEEEIYELPWTKIKYSKY